MRHVAHVGAGLACVLAISLMGPPAVGAATPAGPTTGPSSVLPQPPNPAPDTVEVTPPATEPGGRPASSTSIGGDPVAKCDDVVGPRVELAKARQKASLLTADSAKKGAASPAVQDVAAARSPLHRMSCSAMALARARATGSALPFARSSVVYPNPALVTVSGTLRNLSGTGLAGMTVDIFDAEGAFADEILTGPGGVWSDALPQATYYFAFGDPHHAYPSGWYSVLPPQSALGEPSQHPASGYTAIAMYAARVRAYGTSVTGLNTTLPAVRRISGRITAASGGAGLGGVGVVIYDEFGEYSDTAITNSSGYYTAPVAPGLFHEFVTEESDQPLYAAGWHVVGRPGSFAYDHPDAIDTTAGDRTGIDTALPNGLFISGRATSDGTNGLELIQVLLCGDACYWTQTDATGAYRVRVSSANYLVSFMDGSAERAGGWYSTTGLKADEAHATQVDTALHGSVSNVNATLPLALTISGRVTASTSSGIDVWAFVGQSQYYVTSTDDAGNYSIPVIPGSYALYFGDWSGVVASGWWTAGGVTYDRNAAQLVPVLASSVSSRDLSLPNAVHFRGRVLGADGGWLQGISVSWYRQDASQAELSGVDVTHVDGSYYVAVPPGEYGVTFFGGGSVATLSSVSGGSYGAGYPSSAVALYGSDQILADVTLATVPSKPTSVSAALTYSTATLRWSAPAASNGSAVNGYFAAAYSSTRMLGSCTTAGTSCTISGLSGSYALAVQARNNVGLGLPQAPTRIGGSTYHPILPTRLLDTRIGTGRAGRVPANTPVSFQVTGLAGIPAGASAVTGNVTVVDPSAAWALYLGPAAVASPTSSTINFSAHQTIANGLTVALPATGRIYATYIGPAGNTTDLVFDVTGWYSTTAGGYTYHPIAPVRQLDTRLLGTAGRVRANTPIQFAIGGVHGVPTGIKAVTGNLTVTGSTAGWALYVGPTSVARPTASNLNFAAGETVANNVTVQVDATAKLWATYMGPAGAQTDIVFDVTGYYTADTTGTSFIPLAPARLLDSRYRVGASGVFSSGIPRTFAVRGVGGVSSAATGVTGNLTVTNSTAPWAAFIGPDPIGAPTSSTINFLTGEVRANGVTVALGSTGRLAITYMGPAGASSHFVFDVTGYFVP